jgi:hypothetical protein
LTPTPSPRSARSASTATITSAGARTATAGSSAPTSPPGSTASHAEAGKASDSRCGMSANGANMTDTVSSREFNFYDKTFAHRTRFGSIRFGAIFF